MIGRRSRMLMRAGALAMSLLTVGATAVFADDISNSLDGTIEATAEVMPLGYPGATGTTTLYVSPTNGDGKNGCNLTADKILTISLSSNNPAAATVSPSSITFTSCGATPTVTVTPQGIGTATISASQTANTTGGTFNLAPVAFTVNVTTSVTNTPPSVSVTGVTGGDSYNKGSVPAAGCSVTDTEDGPSTFAATLSAITGPYASDGIGSQVASCSYTDDGGLSASASETYSIVDPSAPVISYLLNPAEPIGDNDWYVSNVTLTWSVSDPESPNSLLKTGCVDQNITADQLETTYSCSATSAGGSAAQVDVKIKRDATVPTPTTTLDSAPDHNGWYSGPAAWTTTGTDATSGIATCDIGTYSGPDGPNLTVSGGCTDMAGNTSGQDASDPFDYDATDPINVSTALDAAPDHNGWYNAPAGWTTTGTDATSLIDSCSSGTYSGPDGTGLTVSGTCTDNAGNTSAPPASSAAFKYDNTNPTASVTGVSNGATYSRGSVPTAGCGTQDNLSGVQMLASLAMSGAGTTNPNGVGSFTATCSGATDNAGNSQGAPVSASYLVIYDSAGFSGILQPINPDNTSLFSRGKAVPVKFRLAGDEPNGFDYSGWTLLRIKVTCTNFVAEEATLEAVAENPSNAFRYDAAADQYINNASFKDQAAGTCWKVRVTLDSLQTMDSAVFRLQK